jgi:pantetheine-phosphate adenylyltransferase
MAETINNDLDKAILVLNLLDIENLAAISAPIVTAAKRTRNRLFIAVFHPSFDEPSGTRSWAPVQKLLTHAYVQATAIAQQQNKILMKVDVVLLGIETVIAEPPEDDWEMLLYTGDLVIRCCHLDLIHNSGDIKNSPIPIAWSSLPSIFLSTEPAHRKTLQVQQIDSDTTSWSFPVVALGGTFDHLHAGHKILLSMAAWITERKIIVGVSGQWSYNLWDTQS